MSNKEFINNLSATYADVRRLDAKVVDAKKIKLKGKELDNITYEGDIYSSYSTPYDLRKGALITNEDGTKTIKDLYCPINIAIENGTFVSHKGWCNEDSAETIKQIVSIKDGAAFDENNNRICIFDSDNLVSVMTNYTILPGSVYTRLIRQYIASLFSRRGDRSSDTIIYENNLKSFKSYLPKLVNGYSMFSANTGSCELLEEFTSPLPNLQIGAHMFKGTSLKSFNIDMPNLECGYMMFAGYNTFEGVGVNVSPQFESFSSDLSKLKDGSWMFIGCNKLTRFDTDLTSLICGDYMFVDTPNLKFNSCLESLVSGNGMFRKANLDANSLLIIMNTIRDIKAEKDELAERVANGEAIENVYKSEGWQSDGSYTMYCVGLPENIDSSRIGHITISLGIENTDEARLQMAKDVLCNSWEEVEAEFTNKGWTVYWTYNGSSSANTLDLENDNSPVWVKLEEILPETLEDGTVIPPRGNYCSEDGTKKYRLDWFHSTNGSTEGYQYFGSLLEACGYFGVIPVKYLEEN